MKPCTNATRFRLEAYRDRGDGTDTMFLSYHFNGSLAKAAKRMTEVVLDEIGEGDGENGGDGPLENCFGDIFNCFMGSGFYAYADCTFHITPFFGTN